MNEKLMIAESDSMKAVMRLAQKVAKASSSALIVGESGVGKEMIANHIYLSGNRKDKPFVKVNCSAIPENLLESELFGYKRGAFTGADPQGKVGYFTQANGGVIFLDEVTEMPLNLQVKLLRVLQEREVTPLGGLEPIPLDIQVIAATNKNIEKLIENGQFREDLYYRLHVVPIYIPPLRERLVELPLLVNHFLKKYNQKYESDISINEQATDLIKAHPWFGNVRELENFIERIVITTDSSQVTSNELQQYLPKIDTVKSNIIVKSIMPLQDAIDSLEEQLITMAMQQYNSVIMAAKILEVSQPTLSRKYKKIKEKWEAKQPREDGLEKKLSILEQELDKQLRSIAIVSATSINVDEVKELFTDISEENPAYTKLQRRLTLIRQYEGDIEWNYIWYINADGKVINMVTDKKLPILPAQEYIGPPEIIEAVHKAFTGTTMVTPKYKDKYGEWKSCLTPIRDENDSIIAILGTDFSVSYVDTQLQKLSRLLLTSPETVEK